MPTRTDRHRRARWFFALLFTATVAAASVAPLAHERSAVAQPGPSFLVSPASLAFPPTQVYQRSSPQQLLITNTGDEPLSFQFLVFDLQLEVTGCTDSVIPTQSCTAEVVFAPTAGGPQFGEGRVIVFPSAGEQLTIPVTARWLPLVPAPVPPLDLGPVQDGLTSARQTLSLRNFWPDDTTITSVSLPTGSLFSIVGSTCGPAIASGATCAIEITFSPGRHVGTARDVLTVTGPWGENGATAAEEFEVEGEGVAAPIISVAPPTLSFPTVLQVGTSSAPQTVGVINTGTADLNLAYQVLGEGPEEFVTSGCVNAVLPPGAGCTISVTFAPLYPGIFPRQVRLELTDPRFAGVATIPITTGYILPLDFEPRAVAFPTTPVGGASAPVTIRARNYNTTTTPVTGYRLSNAQDFAVNSFTCSPEMASGAYCDIVVVFEPTTAGPLSGEVIIFGPFYGEPAQEVVRLSGTGARPPIAGDDTGSVSPGGTTTLDPRANDVDPDLGDVVALPTIVTPPSQGTATIGPDGRLTYVAPRSITVGTVVSLTYSVCDQHGACTVATIRITIIRGTGGLLPATGAPVSTLLVVAASLIVAGVAAQHGTRRRRRAGGD